MNGHDTLDVEAELREMLRRRADDVEPEPPPWTELVRRAESVVVSLQTGRRVDPYVSRAPRRRIMWRQPSFVAVAAAIVTIVGMWVVDQTRSTTSEMADPPTGNATAAVPVPGDRTFDAATAPVVWPSNEPDPYEAARQYLESAGIPASGPGGVSIVVRANDGLVARVEWTRETGPGTEPLRGTVLLRNIAAGTATSRWAVVGAIADGVELDDVRYDGRHLVFTVVNTTDDAPGSLAVTVLADGRPVSVGGRPLPQAGPADPMLGEMIEIDTEVGTRKTLKVDVDGRPSLLIRVQRIGSDHPSVTEMALDPPAIPPVNPTSAGAGAGDRPGGRIDRTDDSTPGAGTNTETTFATSTSTTTSEPEITVPTTEPEITVPTTEPPPTTELPPTTVQPDDVFQVVASALRRP